MKLLIIIPCYNEASSIGSLLEQIRQIKLAEDILPDWVVVNDCSKDNTSQIAMQHGAKVLDLPVNLGIGGAMQTGYKYAAQSGYDLAVQLDGDGQHPPQELQKLIDEYLQFKCNIVIGSRFIVKQGFQSSALRRMGIKYLHWISKILTGKNIYDITSGYRLFDKKAIEIAAKYYPDDYPEPESLVVFSRSGLTISEVPVIMKERQGGRSSIKNFQQLYYIVKVTIAMFFSSIRK